MGGSWGIHIKASGSAVWDWGAEGSRDCSCIRDKEEGRVHSWLSGKGRSCKASSWHFRYPVHHHSTHHISNSHTLWNYCTPVRFVKPLGKSQQVTVDRCFNSEQLEEMIGFQAEKVDRTIFTISLKLMSHTWKKPWHNGISCSVRNLTRLLVGPVCSLLIGCTLQAYSITDAEQFYNSILKLFD